MKTIILFTFLTVSYLSAYTQDMIFNIEEKESSDKKYMGASNFGFYATDYLNVILFFSSSGLGTPVLKKNIKLKTNPIIKIQAYSRFSVSDYHIHSEILKKLLDEYNLQLISSETDSTIALNIISVNQLQPPAEANGGMTPNDSGGFEMTNIPAWNLCFWFAKNNFIVNINEPLLMAKKLSMLVPPDIVENSIGKEETIKTLFEENGIHCEIVKEPALMIVPK